MRAFLPALFFMAAIYSSIDYDVSVTTPINGSFILNPDDRIVTNVGTVRSWLIMQLDGNLVLYHNTNPGVSSDAKWSSGTNTIGGKYAEVNSEGNIMVKDSSDTIQWESNTGGQSAAQPYTLIVYSRCVYLMDIKNTMLWDEGDGCSTAMPTIQPPRSYAPTIGPIALTLVPSQAPTVSTVATDTPTAPTNDLSPSDASTHVPTNIATLYLTTDSTLLSPTNDGRVIATSYVSWISPTTVNINTAYDADNSSLVVISVALVVVSLITIVLFIYVIRIRNCCQKRKKASVDVENVCNIAVDDAVNAQCEGEMHQDYNNEVDIQKDPQLLDQAPSSRIESDKDSNGLNGIDLDEKATVGEGVDVVMRDDEFEVIGDDEHNHDTEGR